MPEKRLTLNTDKMSEKMKFIIDSYACYHSPARIEKGIIENFGEEAKIKIKTIYNYKIQYEDLILARRKELGATLPIMNPASRFEMAQEIYNMSIAGIPRITKGGTVVDVPDPRTAIEAIKLAHAMSGTKDDGQVMDSDIIRSVVKETFQSLKEANPDKSEMDIASLMMSSMEEDSKPYIEELTTGLIH